MGRSDVVAGESGVLRVQLLNVLLIVGGAILAWFIAIPRRPTLTKWAKALAILVPVALVVSDQVVWAMTRKSILDHITCAAMPRAPSCFAMVEPAVQVVPATTPPAGAAGAPAPGSSRTQMVMLVRGEDPSGAPIYAFVVVPADRLQEFMAAQRRGLFYPENFGEVVRSGSGEPAEAVYDEMQARYGFDRYNMIDLH